MRLINLAVALTTASLAPAAFGGEPATTPPNADGAIFQIEGKLLQPGSPFVLLQDDVGKDTPRPPVAPPANPFEAQQRVRYATSASVNARREKGSYLGVSASPPAMVLRKQLGILPGMGLVIDFVVPDSPAAAAGLQQFDVLQKLDDQLIINPQQLAVLVRSHKPGDEIKLGLIREGKSVTLTAKLSEHELEPLVEDEGDNIAARMHQVAPGPMFHPDIRPNPGPAAAGSVTWLEDGLSYTVMVTPDGHKTFTQKDKDGKVLSEGPIDTKEQIDRLPPGQKEKLKRMEQHLPSATTAPQP